MSFLAREGWRVWWSLNGLPILKCKGRDGLDPAKCRQRRSKGEGKLGLDFGEGGFEGKGQRQRWFGIVTSRITFSFPVL
jgi:hypothetical protein